MPATRLSITVSIFMSASAMLTAGCQVTQTRSTEKAIEEAGLEACDDAQDQCEQERATCWQNASADHETCVAGCADDPEDASACRIECDLEQEDADDECRDEFDCYEDLLQCRAEFEEEEEITETECRDIFEACNQDYESCRVAASDVIESCQLHCPGYPEPDAGCIEQCAVTFEASLAICESLDREYECLGPYYECMGDTGDFCSNGPSGDWCRDNGYVLPGPRPCFENDDPVIVANCAQWAACEDAFAIHCGDNFQCDDGSYVSDSYVCDGASDCAGGEDEADCGSGSGSEDPGSDAFVCSDGSSVSEDYVCDGAFDCPGGDDEAGCGSGSGYP